MESLVERPFARLLRTRMQPVEVAKRLTRELEAQRTVAINRVLVPNHFEVALSAVDFDHFAPIQALLQREMISYVTEYAAEHKYTLPGEVQVALQRDEALRPNSLRIATRMDEFEDGAGTTPLQPTQVMPPAPPASQTRPPLPTQQLRARIELDGASCYLDRDVATMGRGLDNDVVVEDRRVSRHHARLQRGPRGWEIMDLASTNGTFVNGRAVKQRPIAAGETISLGGLEMTFHLEKP